MRYLKKKNIVYVNSDFNKEKDLLLAEYHKKVEAGLSDIKYNRVISKEDLEKEMLDWDSE